MSDRKILKFPQVLKLATLIMSRNCSISNHETSLPFPDIFNVDCRSALNEMIEAQGSTEILFGNTGTKKSGLHSGTQADSPIKFSQLSKANDLASAGDIFELGLSQALGTSKKESAADFSSSKLSKVTQLTGFSDPIYAEAYVHVHQYDIVLDVLIGK